MRTETVCRLVTPFTKVEDEVVLLKKLNLNFNKLFLLSHC